MIAVTRTLVLGSLLAIAAPTAVVSAQGVDPIIGTWELNVAKSKYTPGPGPKSETRTYTATASGYTFASKGVGADGKPINVTFAVAFDGKYHAMTGSPTADSIMVKRIDANSTESTQKKGAKVVTNSTRVVSKDGKTMTNTSKGTDAAGNATSSVVVFDKK
jgi:hypothetical protein